MGSIRHLLRIFWVTIAAVSISSELHAQAIRIHVDLTDAPKNIYRSQLQIPVKAGDISLVFPKWIPGNHRPSGPIGGLTGIRMSAGGHSINWERDPIEMTVDRTEVTRLIRARGEMAAQLDACRKPRGRLGVRA